MLVHHIQIQQLDQDMLLHNTEQKKSGYHTPMIKEVAFAVATVFLVPVELIHNRTFL